jgi:hypothetical protein
MVGHIGMFKPRVGITETLNQTCHEKYSSH